MDNKDKIINNKRLLNFDNGRKLIELPDIQQTMSPCIKSPIKQVGVQNIKTNFLLESVEGKTHNILANVCMSTDLNSQTKGISMSRLVRTLIKYLDKPLNHEIVEDILKAFKISIETGTEDSFIKFDFSLPIQKKAPISGLVFPQFYKCSFEGRLVKDKFDFYQKVIVPYQSYCPCSASLCEHLEYYGYKGFPHAQRCTAEVILYICDSKVIFLEEIINLVEESVVNKIFPILKREDEQEVARIAAQNPMFVEDAIRFISDELEKEKRIKDWIIKCTHEESIHTHEAIAINWKGVVGGFDGLKFI